MQFMKKLIGTSDIIKVETENKRHIIASSKYLTTRYKGELKEMSIENMARDNDTIRWRDTQYLGGEVTG